MNKKKILLLVLSVTMMMSLVACGGGGDTGGGSTGGGGKPIKLSMSVTGTESSTWTKGAERFSEIVKEKTDGEIDITVYPNEQLSGGNQGKGIEMLRNGSTDLSFHSNIIYSIMDERFGVISLPWLMSTYEEVDAKLNGEGGEKINEILDEIGIVGLGFGENGFRQITNTKTEIKTPDDMKGLKIRVPGIKMYISLYQALGADPISMNFAEVFTALQQKAIDGQENPSDIISSSKIYEVQDYLTEWNYSYDSIILGMNKDKFESLSEEHQKIIREAAKEAVAYQVEINREAESEQREMFMEEGLEITTLTEAEIDAFKEKVQVVYDEYEPIIGKELIDAFR